MPCADAASRKYEWENSVSRFCQVKDRFVEPHIDEASNIFPKHPTGPQFGNNAAHLRPQVAFIRKAPPLSCGGEGLAGKAAREDGNGFKSCFFKKRLLRKSRDIPESRHLRPVLFQNGIGIVRPLALADGAEARRLRRQIQPANAGKQAHMGQLICYFVFTCGTFFGCSDSRRRDSFAAAQAVFLFSLLQHGCGESCTVPAGQRDRPPAYGRRCRR